MTGIKEVTKNVFAIDNQLYGIPQAGTVYLVNETRKALVDTGPATSSDTVLEGIKKAGCRPEDIDYIIITHIHLDHARGTGTLLAALPQARVLVHKKGVRHIIDPTRLVSSSIDAQGAEAVAKNGDIVPVDETRIIPVSDGDEFRLSDEEVLTILECPGHAPHELCIQESRNGGVFAGDAVGHCLENLDIMVPITPPPSFDFELYRKSLDRLRQTGASYLYFAHSCTSDRVAEKLDLAEQKLNERRSVIERAIKEHQPEQAAQILTDHILGELAWIRDNMPALYRYWADVDVPMSAKEHVRYHVGNGA